MGLTIVFLHSHWFFFSVTYTSFKIFRNFKLNPVDAYLYSSEFILSFPGGLSFFVSIKIYVNFSYVICVPSSSNLYSLSSYSYLLLFHKFLLQKTRFICSSMDCCSFFDIFISFKKLCSFPFYVDFIKDLLQVFSQDVLRLSITF